MERKERQRDAPEVLKLPRQRGELNDGLSMGKIEGKRGHGSLQEPELF